MRALLGPDMRSRERGPDRLGSLSDASEITENALDFPAYAEYMLPQKRYPHLVFYVERDDHIDVWRVLHSQRDLPAWMREPET